MKVRPLEIIRFFVLPPTDWHRFPAGGSGSIPRPDPTCYYLLLLVIIYCYLLLARGGSPAGPRVAVEAQDAADGQGAAGRRRPPTTTCVDPRRLATTESKLAVHCHACSNAAMKTTFKRKKLSLSKSVIRNLRNASLGEVVGGHPNRQPSHEAPCESMMITCPGISGC